MHGYCCYVTQSIYIGVKKRTVAEFEWSFATTEHSLYFKSSAIEETLIKPIRFNFTTFKEVISNTFF